MKNYKSLIIKGIKQGCLFYAFSTLLITLQFGLYITDSSILEMMDLGGWLFFITSCISHAAMFALIPYLLSLIFTFCKCTKTARIVQIVGIILLCIINYLNSQVYAIYHFHINGFVLNMVFGEGASEIFNFDIMLYLKEIALFLVVAAIVIGVWYVSYLLWKKRQKAYAWTIAGCIIGCTLFAHLCHIYGAFYQQPSVMKSSALLPYYFPTTSNGLLQKLGCTPPRESMIQMNGKQSADIQYPIQPLQKEKMNPDSLPNIIFILIDSWNTRSLTAECMPNAYQFAQQNQWFSNHVSGSNGTRSGVFSLFFGLSCYYWESFDPAHIQPVFIKRLQELGYEIQTYPSATFADPPFGRVIFGGVPGIHTETKGNTPLERDTRIAEEFISDSQQHKKSGKPFFSFLFFDLPHSFGLPADKNKRFQPAWAYADYTKLSNDMDPTPFWNMYRNCCYQDDLLLGRIFETLKKEGLMDNTIIILSGDHSQEFNENHHNYWGHNGNFSKAQIGVPMIWHVPGAKPHKFMHRTTHYDVVPTLMKNHLGIKNNPADYSMGRMMMDKTPRLWHVVGSNLNYAFIINNDTILEKTADGALDVYDAHMNPVKNYRLPAKQFDKAIKQLNRFFK
mgnify:FL=1